MRESREQQILDYLQKHNLATVQQLVYFTGASASTIRRDLIKLNAERRVYRVHGSVSLADAVHQPTTSEKVKLNRAAKLRIAAAAAELIHDGDSLVLDAGTTTIELARLLLNKSVRIITTDLNIAMLLIDHPGISVAITGGILDASSQSCIGELARSMLRHIHPTYTFISCNAWDAQLGITAPTAEKAGLKSELLHLGGKAVLLADSSKYGKSQLFEVGHLQELDMVITDHDLPAQSAKTLEREGISVQLV